MVARTAAWLKSRRDGNGGYLRDAKALDTFGRASPEVTDAYITWALASAGETGLEQEIAKSAQPRRDDAGRVSARARHRHAAAARRGCATVEGRARRGVEARPHADRRRRVDQRRSLDHAQRRREPAASRPPRSRSSRSSSPRATGSRRARASSGCRTNRSGFGQWGATQATVLALKAMTTYDNVTRVAPHAGAVSLVIDGVVVAEQSFDAGGASRSLFTGFDERLAPGKHRITLRSQHRRSAAVLDRGGVPDHRTGLVERGRGAARRDAREVRAQDGRDGAARRDDPQPDADRAADDARRAWACRAGSPSRTGS